MTHRNADHRPWVVSWTRAGVVAAGVGAALVVAPGIASAAPGEESGADRGAVSAGTPDSASAAANAPVRPKPERARGAAQRSVNRPATTPLTGRQVAAAAAPARVAAAAVPSRRGNAAVAQPVSAPVPGVAPAAAPAQPAAQAQPVQAAPVVPVASVIAGVPTPAARATAPSANASLNLPIGPIRAAILAAQAFIYGYPLLEFERARAEVAELNTIYSLTSFANPDVDPVWVAIGGGKRPNTDTFYSLAYLDLSEGPVVLSIPDMGDRYFSFQLTEPYISVADYIGSRTTGPGPGRYAITWSGGLPVEVPDDVEVVEVPYASMMMLGRTLAGDAADQAIAIELMKQYTLTPTGQPNVPPFFVPASRNGVDILNTISNAMVANPAPAIDDPKLAQLAKIGVGPGLQISDANLGFFSTIAVDLAVRATSAVLPLLANLIQYTSALQNRGWAIPNSSIGDYGTDYLFRAGVAEVGWVANTPEEATYYPGLLGRYLLPLFGFPSRVLHFAPGETPPVDADGFWSVTVYDGNGNLYKNPANRYSVSNSRPEELVYQSDGSLTIVFSHKDPGDPDVNWLPVPLGFFEAYMRMYVPSEEILTGTWKAPGIRWA
ncbi:MAG: DUF1254 domain-containing protein [Mycobacterium sp.]